MSTPESPQRLLPLAPVQEGERVLRICNACRYCEGFCAVFPALERRLEFSVPDIVYLANLCHDCGECLYACQYAPPHEFAVDVPKVLAQIRVETYRRYAWPSALGGLFGRDTLVRVLCAIGAPGLFLLSLGVMVDWSELFGAHTDADGAFYRVLPHEVMIGVFGVLGALAAVALVVGLARFWRDMGGTAATFLTPRVFKRALSDAMTLRYLDGGSPGAGCAYPDDRASPARRRYHHLTFYGFLLCFAATTVAAVYHNVMGWQAPYALSSLPVVLGCLGGIGLLAGPLGLFSLKMRCRPERRDQNQTGMDMTFLIMLFLTSLTGFLLLAVRESASMGVMLGLHLGLVMGLFLAMPYGKFVHGLYRFAALVRHAGEVTAAEER